MLKTNCSCFHCGKEIYRKPSRLKKNNRNFCSIECSSKTIKEEFGTYKEYDCNQCGKKVIKTKNQRRSSKSGLCFCGNDCKNSYIASNLRWSDNPLSHRQRRPRLLESSNHCCQKCGYNDFPELLDIHHNDGDHSNNKWENLRVVCVRCHQEHHRAGIDLKLPALLKPPE